MGRKIDIGGYFEQLTRKAQGGRRTEEADDGASTSERTDVPRSRVPVERASDGGLSGRLKDMLGKARGTAGTAATKARDKAKGRGQTRPTSTAHTRGQRPSEGVVTIEYSPRLDGDPDPGEVVWTWVPYEEDPTQGKDRPVVVIGRRGERLVGVPLTTKSNDREAQVVVGTGDWDPKRRTSYARIWRMLDIEADGMRREGAVLERARFDAVVTAVDEYYDIRQAPAPKDTDFDFDY